MELCITQTYAIIIYRANKVCFYVVQANIRIKNPSANYGDNPWVKQTGGCGVPGEFMHLTPSFLLNKAYSERKYGPAGMGNANLK